VAELPKGGPGNQKPQHCSDNPRLLTTSLFALLEASFLGIQQVVNLAYEHQQFVRVLLFHSLLAEPH